jgi:hypothetical protein
MGLPAKSLSGIEVGQDIESAVPPQEYVAGILPAPKAGGETALTLAHPTGSAMAPADQQEALRRYRILAPILLPAKFPERWVAAGQKKSGLVDLLAAEHGVERSTLYRWLSLWDRGGLPALVPRKRSDAGTSRTLNAAARDFILAAALPKKEAYGEYSVKELVRAYSEERKWRSANAGRPLKPAEAAKYRRYLDEAGELRADAQLPEASYSTLARYFQLIPEPLKVMACRGEDAFAATQDVLSFRDLTKTRPLQFVVCDHRVLDLFALVPTRGGWRLSRPWISAALDMRTRKWLSWVICEVPSSTSIAAVLKKVVFKFGIPEEVYWDNGRDYRSVYLEAGQLQTSESHRIADLGDRMGGVLSSLGIRVRHAIVKRARAKLIEPAFVNTANFDRSLIWYCGHRPDARPDRLAGMVRRHELWIQGKASESPFPTFSHIAGLYDSFLESVNNREHSGIGMEKVTPTGRGFLTPNEAFAALVGNVPRRTAPPEVLQMAFQRRKTLRVRNGEVCATFSGRQVHYRMLDNPLRLMGLNGRVVEMGFDEDDLSWGALYVDGSFVGLLDAAELRSMGGEDFVIDERNRRAARREVKKFIETVHGAIPIATAEERAMRRAAIVPALIEPAREEQAAEMPAALVAAAAALEKRRSFRFSDDVPAIGVLTQGRDVDAETNPGDDEFKFFAGEAT